MRLPTLLSIGLAAFGAAGLGSPALAEDGQRHDHDMPGMDMPMDHRDMPPPPGYPGEGSHPGHGGPDGPWHYPDGPMPGPWLPPCAERPEPADAPPCGAYPYYPAYPMMTYAVPMMMVPVLRQKPCPEEVKVIEEWVEEPAPVRRRHIPPRAKDKRVKMVPDKRIPY